MKKTVLALLICAFLASLFVFAASAEASEPANAQESSVVAAENEQGAVEELAITFNPAGFLTHIGKMGFGMIGIFIVIGVIVVITYALNKLSTGKKKN